MAYQRVYDNRINWENEPSHKTALGQQNLNKMDYALYVHDQRIVELNGYEAKAELEAENAEAWAIGKRDGEAVASTDETYNNNSKYYSEKSYEYSQNANTSKEEAKLSETKASLSESKALQSENNAKTSETNAKASEDNAYDSEGKALQYKNSAKTSETNAKTSENNALSYSQNAQTASQNATAMVNDTIQKINSGYFKGEKGDKGDTGESGVVFPISGFFTMAVDSDGNLYAYSESNLTDMFDYDSETGSLYFVTEVD